MDAILTSIFDSDNAEGLALAATALFTLLFQMLKARMPDAALLPVSVAVGAALGVLGAWYGPDASAVFDYVVAAAANAAIPTGYFKIGQRLGLFASAKLRPGADTQHSRPF